MSDVTTPAAEAALKVTATVGYGGAGAAVYFGKFTANELAAFVAILCAVLGFVANACINWYWRRKTFMLLEQEHIERRQRDVPVATDRRRQGGAINRMLVAAMSSGALVTALAGYVVLDEGDGPTTVSDVGEKIHHAYPDPAHGWAVPTICQGRTKGVTRGMTATASECREWLERELRAEVIASLVRHVKAPVTFEQAVALGRFRDNVGEGGFRASKLLREVNAGNCHAAAREFNDAPQIDRASGKPRIWTGRPIKDRKTGAVLLATGDTIKKWTTGALVPLPGLIKRRAEERALFETGCLAMTAAASGRPP